MCLRLALNLIIAKSVFCEDLGRSKPPQILVGPQRPARPFEIPPARGPKTGAEGCMGSAWAAEGCAKSLRQSRARRKRSRAIALQSNIQFGEIYPLLRYALDQRIPLSEGPPRRSEPLQTRPHVCDNWSGFSIHSTQTAYNFVCYCIYTVNRGLIVLLESQIGFSIVGFVAHRC